MADLRFALRSFFARPGFAAAVILTIALAVGVNTAIFSVVESVLLRPLRFPQPEALVRIYTRSFSRGDDRAELSRPELLELRRDGRSFSSLSAWLEGTVTFNDPARAVRVPAAYVTADLAATLGVTPARGRFFTADEDVPGPLRAVVISDGLWRRAFGADPTVVGRRITLEGDGCTITGVMPPGFDFPAAGIEAWVPLGLHPGDLEHDRAAHGLQVVGRLRPGTDLAVARAELVELTRRAATHSSPSWHTLSSEDHPLAAYSLKDELVQHTRTPLWLLQAAALFVLLIACVNVGNLFLIRAESRSRELAVRAALGAGRLRLVRLFLLESLVGAGAGGALGVLLAAWATGGLARLLPAGAPRAQEVAVDARVLGFALACVLVAALAVALAPLRHTSVGDLQARLAQGGRSHTRRSRLRDALVAAEVAAAMLLALGCGVVVKSLHRLQQVDLGFRPEGLLVFELEINEPLYPTSEGRTAFWERLQGELESVPGVTGVTLSDQLPTETEPPKRRIGVPGWPASSPGAPIVEWTRVGDNFFATLGMRLVAGRLPRPTDTRVVVLNQTAAARLFPAGDAVGKVVNVFPSRSAGALTQTVIGVVADVKQHGAARPAGSGLYFPLRDVPELFGQTPFTLAVIVRAAAPQSVAGLVEAAVRRVDPALPLFRVRTMERVVWESVARPRFLASLMTALAGLALLLAAIGVYGVMAYSVEQRTRELAIRVALGARPREAQALVIRHSLGLAGAGIAVGIAAAAALSAVLPAAFEELLFETRALDAWVVLLVATLVMAVALVASLTPARRALRVDPMVALRAE